MPHVLISCPKGARRSEKDQIALCILRECAAIPALELDDRRKFTMDLEEENRIFGNDIIVIFQGLYKTHARSTRVLRQMTEAVAGALKAHFHEKEDAGVECFIDHGDRETCSYAAF